MDATAKTISKSEQETIDKVRAYVQVHYAKMFGNAKVIIKEFSNHFQISKLEDSSPLILGKGILTKEIS